MLWQQHMVSFVVLSAFPELKCHVMLKNKVAAKLTTILSVVANVSALRHNTMVANMVSERPFFGFYEHANVSIQLMTQPHRAASMAADFRSCKLLKRFEKDLLYFLHNSFITLESKKCHAQISQFHRQI